ncbi:uncharacterized protein LOC131163609 [Malania oleifera]|uniref:uncharacterized protein LOC131163609 n=1 Tax=Malania oleifera TaxID=397392 RepID=UPI0025AE7397|nr:uncharacterized protein LOC131163609 [Malania oleifera]
MLPPALSSLMYARKRRVMEVFPPNLRKLWKEWELRVMVLLSLSLQIILILFGNRRRYINKIWIRILIWSSYLMADWVAAVALGVISNNLGDVNENDAGKESTGELHPSDELTAFWAPFLLLHLGGPDTITAYSLEDNELWLRHLLGLLVQAGVAIYIFLMAWTGSRLSMLSFLVMLTGLIKYGERTWVLRSASIEQFRDSMLTSPDPGPNYPKFMEEVSLKQAEGYFVKAEEVIEAQDPASLSSGRNNSIRDADELIKAYDLFQTFKRLFVDLILSFQDRDSSQSVFKAMLFGDAFKVIEIELGFMYDVLYTKARIIYTLRGWGLRLVTFSFTCFVLGCFSFTDERKFSGIDLAITFLLLVVAILLEIYAILLLLSSDWTDRQLSKHNKSASVRRAITSLQLRKTPRWSNSMAQYSALSLCLNEKPAFCIGIQKLFHIDTMLEKQRYINCKEVPVELKEFIFDHVKEKFDTLKEKQHGEFDAHLKVLCLCRGDRVLEKYGFLTLDWSTKFELNHSILIWHIATDICYYVNRGRISNTTIMSKCKMSRRVSRYMLYLLVIYPFMLPIGIGQIRFRDTCTEATRFFKERKCISEEKQSYSWVLNCFRRKKSLSSDIKEACNKLLGVNTSIPPTKVKGDRSKSVLFDACRLAGELQSIRDENIKWEMISNVWVEMLAYAANQCRGNYHAQQLRRGGELLTHVWLLMAHFGIAESFQISQGHARAKLVVM